MMENREKEKEAPIFSLDDRSFNVKAWYLKDTEESKGEALVQLRYGEELVRELLFPAYKIWNIAAHFSDIVDGELSRDDTARGYRIAADTLLGGIFVEPREPKQEGRR
jgi:hypothetical protein